MTKKYDYDAIIIGAGIGGLVCGCYLAKAGMKALIVEKNAKPGGYCTSFKRGGFHFDACVHSLGSLREDGNIKKVLRELELEDRLKVRRYDPSDIIITPHLKVNFWNDLKKTIQEFQGYFPDESRNINNFFEFLNNIKGIALSSLRRITFEELLGRYFKNDILKNILSFPLLGNAGLPASQISALTGSLIYKEFMFDGGYYPDNSIQAFPNALANRFRELGGQIIYSSLVKKMIVVDNKIYAIDIGEKDQYSSEYIISNVDAKQTFLSLIGKNYLNEYMLNTLNSLAPSLSMFILYLGVKKDLNTLNNIPLNTNIWYLPNYDVDGMYKSAINGDITDLDCFLVRLLSDKESMLVLVFAPFNNQEYWKVNKKYLIDHLINKVNAVIPGLSSNILFKDAATPITLYKRTLNHKGASYGWAGTPSQLAIKGLTQTTLFENLFLTGHWTTLTQGVSGVAYLGRHTSQKVLNKANRL
jgi:prolycopene isomerase